MGASFSITRVSHMGPVLGDNRCPGWRLHRGRLLWGDYIVTLYINILFPIIKKTIVYFEIKHIFL
jgi:hypothetical protein